MDISVLCSPQTHKLWLLIDLIVCNLKFCILFLSSADFQKKLFKYFSGVTVTVRVSDGLDLDQARHLVWVPNCLQMLSADDNQRINQMRAQKI